MAGTREKLDESAKDLTVQRIDQPSVKSPRVAYQRHDGTYFLLGHRPYFENGELKQAAAMNVDIKSAVHDLDLHESTRVYCDDN